MSLISNFQDHVRTCVPIFTHTHTYINFTSFRFCASHLTFFPLLLRQSLKIDSVPSSSYILWRLGMIRANSWRNSSLRRHKLLQWKAETFYVQYLSVPFQIQIQFTYEMNSFRKPLSKLQRIRRKKYVTLEQTFDIQQPVTRS